MLLLHDFKLKFDMPIDHLCPPVPMRLNYVHWVADLLRSPEPNPSIRGVDMYFVCSIAIPIVICAVALVRRVSSPCSARACTVGGFWRRRSTPTPSIRRTQTSPPTSSSPRCVCVVFSTSAHCMNVDYIRCQIEVRHVADRKKIFLGVLRPDEK